MGQRSQIYIAYNNGDRLINGKLTKRGQNELVARYFQWNYGSRMVSRAWGLIDWLKGYIGYLNYHTNLIPLVAQVNFDFRDITLTIDLIKEANEIYNEDVRGYVFGRENNNDGKLFIDVCDDGTIKYAFTDYYGDKPMTAEQYMEWGGYPYEEENGSHCSENIKNIANTAILMTEEELKDFKERPYYTLGDEPLF